MVFLEQLNFQNCFEAVKSLLMSGELSAEFELCPENLAKICMKVGVSCTSTNCGKIKSRIFGSKVSAQTPRKLALI